jgi:hypothetical protein
VSLSSLKRETRGAGSRLSLDLGWKHEANVMPLIGPPKIEKLAAKGDIGGLVRALGYTKDRQVARANSAAGESS